MRILMQTRPDWQELQGGDYVQLSRWAAWLRKLGVKVVVSDKRRPDLRGLDIAHFHNLGRAFSLWEPLEQCRRAGIPTVLTPLYWPAEEYERRGRPGITGLAGALLPQSVAQRLKAGARWLFRGTRQTGLLREFYHGTTASARRFLDNFDAHIVNSQIERDQLLRLMGKSLETHVVHSGVDATYWSEDKERIAIENDQYSTAGLSYMGESTHHRNGVLCVARFDPQKAQHRLIKALRILRTPLTLAGPDNPNYPGYRAYCRRLAGPEVTILPSQDATQLRELYSKCKVHALCSWYETTGLTGLEAGCCGARVVVTSRGGTRDYGSNLVWYADPTDIGSIRRAVLASLEADETPDLRSHVIENFNWETSAKRLYSVYEEILKNRESQGRAA